MSVKIREATPRTGKGVNVNVNLILAKRAKDAARKAAQRAAQAA